ncbi:MAG: intradiol ring-cleavage dioxygenase [bacterium]|jgi:protocatechuate 3,4-dioxygenase, beta subunit
MSTKVIPQLLVLLIFIEYFALAQVKVEPRLVGGACEGCEAILEFNDRWPDAVDTLPDFSKSGQKIKITGTVFRQDGIIPAADVILYIYHTDQTGVYPTTGEEKGWARRHGYLRGWVKTDQNGHYAFYTLKPGEYPNHNEPAHIHLTVMEPDGKYYWLESYHFAGDDLLTDKEINPENPRGGSTGLVTLEKRGDIWVGSRDVVLGKNIPGYF